MPDTPESDRAFVLRLLRIIVTLRADPFTWHEVRSGLGHIWKAGDLASAQRGITQVEKALERVYNQVTPACPVPAPPERFKPNPPPQPAPPPPNVVKF